MQNKESLYAMALALIGLTAGAAEAQAPLPVAPRPAPRATNPGPATITGVTVATQDKTTQIVITADKAFKPEVNSLGRATVITIPGHFGAGRGKVVSLGTNGVTTVRYGQFTQRPQPLVRITANTTGNLEYTMNPSADGTRWEILIAAPGVAAPAASPVRQPARNEGFIKPIPPGTTASTTAKPAVGKPGVTPAAPVYTTRVNNSATQPYSGLLKMPEAQPESRPQPFTPAPVTPAVDAGTPQVIQNPIVVADAGKPAPTAPNVAGTNGTAPPEETRRLSLDFVATDINDVLKALSLQANINIVTGNDVKGPITVSLKRVTVLEALDMVTRLSGYTYARFGSAYVIGTPASVSAITASSATPVENITVYIPYRYASTAVMYRVLQDKFPGIRLPEAPKDELPSQPKMLVLTDTPKRTAEVRAFVNELETQVASIPVQGGVTEAYPLKYVSPADMINLLANLVPTVRVQVGPSQAFQPSALGGSASFQSGGTYGSSGGGASSGSSGGGASSGAGAQTGGASGGRSQPSTLVLTGAPEDIARAKQVIAQLDIRVPQIRFEAKVMDINNDDLTQLGLTYDVNRRVDIGENNVVPGTANVGNATTGGSARPVNFGTIFRTPYSIGVTLDALTTTGRSKVLASPNISALDGQPATVFIGDQVKYVIAIQQSPTGQTIQTETATVGVTLRVTGKTSPDGTITVYVHPEVSVITDYLDAGGGISLPQISTRFVDTTARVKSGDTIMIGGLIREADIENIKKVPFLSKLPFFGELLFTRREKQKQASQLVIFIKMEVVPE